MHDIKICSLDKHKSGKTERNVQNNKGEYLKPRLLTSIYLIMEYEAIYTLIILLRGFVQNI